MLSDRLSCSERFLGKVAVVSEIVSYVFNYARKELSSHPLWFVKLIIYNLKLTKLVLGFFPEEIASARRKFFRG